MSVLKYEEESDNNSLLDYTGNDSLLYESSTSVTYPASFPEPRLSLLDGKFFQYIPERSSPTKVVALCVKCLPRQVEVRGFGNCSSNFLSHLKRRHGESTVAEYKKYVKYKPRLRGAIKQNKKNNSNNNSERKSVPLVQKFEETSEKQTNPFEDNIFKFFISAMLPTRAIEDPYFSKMFLDLNLFDLQIPTQQNLEQQIKSQYSREMAETKQMLSELEYICIAVNIWNDEKHSVVAMTGHWITQEMQRQSVALACRSIKHRNFETDVTSLVQEIYSDLEMNENQIVGTVTGNGSNYVQAFGTFGVQLTNILLNNELELEDCISFDADNLKFNGSSGIENNYLPCSLKCCIYLLSRVLIQVINEELYYCNNTPLSNLHMATMNKCNILWEAAGHSNLAEVITFQLGKNLIRPNYNSWNSLFNSLQEILATRDKSFQLHKALNLQNPLTEMEFNYLQEYLTCTAPIAEALNILQAEKNSYYGIVMPCLFALRRNLLSIAGKTMFMYCQKLINDYVDCVSMIFAEFYDLSTEVSQNAAIAALSFPRFKNQWLICVEKAQQEEILRIFKTVISKEMNIVQTTPESQSMYIGHNKRESAFFNFGGESETENSKIQLRRSLNAPFVKAEAQMLQFFAEESTDLSSLDNYPELKKVFIKYNTPLPSLAFGENLFSMSSINELRMNHKAFNPLYEKRLILNANMNMVKY